MESDSGEGHGKTWIEDGGCRGESGMEETAVGSQREKTGDFLPKHDAQISHCQFKPCSQGVLWMC